MTSEVALSRNKMRDRPKTQCFVNLADNAFLDHGVRDFGYAVFAEVVAGMDVVDRIAAGETGRRNGIADVPVEPVVVREAYRVEAP